MNRFFLSKSGRSYVLLPDGRFLSYERESDGWVPSRHPFAEVQQTNRLNELPSHLEFVHYVRHSYERQFPVVPRRSSANARD